MLLNKRTLVLTFALLLPVAAFAADESDPQAYCAYVMEQAQAQRDALRTPIAAAGMTQPETALPVQVVEGASLGLSSLRKADLTIDAARKNCEAYKSTVTAGQSIQYALPSLEKDALQNRLTLIEQARKSLSSLMEKTSQMVEAQNATRMMLFSLQTTKIKLDADRAETQSKVIALYAPPLSDRPLRELVAAKRGGDASEQKALDKLNRQNNWDVALSVGLHQQVSPVAGGTQPYGAVMVTYNLGSRAINKHLDRAVEAYDEWKKVQEGDVVRSMEVLRQQLSESLSVQEAKLKALLEESSQIDQSLRLVANPDTSAALDLSNQLTVAQLLLTIETSDASFRIDRLRVFLAKNY